MLIKELTLENFRQFKEKKTIIFSTDTKHNITIIMGENGSGKTTLAQAFLWLLYAETDFKDKKVVNKKFMSELYEGQEGKVRVELIVEEDGVELTIVRKQNYIKRNNRIESRPVELIVSQKVNGKTQYIPDRDAQYIIEALLPKQLSGFFFFDGERIKNMSEEIQKGKSKEFASAVRSLVGLNTIMNTMNHLRETRSSVTVIGRYNKKIEEVGGGEISNLSRQIEVLEKRIESSSERKEKLEPQIEYYQKESIRLEEQIISFASAEKMKEDYDFLTRKTKVLENEKISSIKTYLKHFNNYGRAFFVTPLIGIINDELEKSEKLDKGIPHVHAETIDYLIKRKKCICGNNIESCSEEFITLSKLLDYLPPKSIGTLINTNIEIGNSLLKQGETFNEFSENHYKTIRQKDKELQDTISEQTDIYNKIIDTSNLYKLREKKNEAERKAKSLKSELDNLIKAIGADEKEMKSLKVKKEEFINLDKSNQKLKLFRNYARELYKILEEEYSEAEITVREDLEKKINRIFTDIYDGGLTLSLDNNYNIKIRVNELEENHDDVERSTAQNYTVIFAFIAGIIEMAKEKSSEEDSTIFDNAVGYPLVMDAPLSAFDKRRIKNICDTIPKIAEQVIFFIKDTDGYVAEMHLGGAVGRKYVIKKESLIVSKIEERV